MVGLIFTLSFDGVDFADDHRVLSYIIEQGTLAGTLPPDQSTTHPSIGRSAERAYIVLVLISRNRQAFQRPISVFFLSFSRRGVQTTTVVSFILCL